MELMDISLDKFYRFVHHRLQQKIPESILGKIALAVISFYITTLSSIQNVISYYILDCPSFKLLEREPGNNPP